MFLRAEALTLVWALAGLTSSLGEGATHSDWIARAWQSDDGLPDNSVIGISQAREGHLVVSTQRGVAEFDGLSFNRLDLPLPQGRPAPLIRVQLLATDNQLWLAFEGSMVIGVGPRGSELITTREGLPGFRPLSMAETRDGAIWVGYADGSACRILDGRVTRYTARDGLPGTGGCWLAQDHDRTLWFAKAGRIGLFRNGRFQTLVTVEDRSAVIGTAARGGVWIAAGKELFGYHEGDQLRHAGRLPLSVPAPRARVLLENPEGVLWVGTTASGLFRFDGTNIARVETSHSSIQSLAVDRENSLWVGTGGGGLNRLRPRILHLEDAKVGLPFERVRSVCQDDAGRIWAVGENGMVALKQNAAWRALSTNDGWPGARATCVAAGRGRVWIGTYRGGLFSLVNGAFVAHTRQDGLGGDIVRSLFVDPEDRLWLGLESPNCLQRFDGTRFDTFSQPQNSRNIRALTRDSVGAIWAGTTDGFLLRVEDDKLVNHTHRTLDTPRPIRTLLASPDGALWIGFANAGLGRLTESGFARLGLEQGLPDSYICGMQFDANGSLWCAADQGLFRIERMDLENALATGARATPVAYGRDQGLPNLQGNYGYAPTSLRDPSGAVWFAMQTGLAVAHPDREQPGPTPPPLRVDRVAVDSQVLFRPKPGAQIRLRPGNRRLRFDFAALSFIAPEQVRTRHRLENWEDEWTETTGTRSASYTRLPVGHYRFRLMAANEGGPWSPEITLGVVVRPFFWQTGWFWFAGLGIGAFGLGLGVRSLERRRLRQRMIGLERENAVERERARLARDIHDELGAGLAQIALLADVAGNDPPDPGKTQEIAAKIADRARVAVKSLDEIVWTANPRNDNLPRLAEYLCQTLDDCFESTPVRCRKDVPTGLPKVPVSAEVRHHLVLAVKEAATNALKHSKAGTVWLRLRWEQPLLTVTVEDDGIGFDARKPPGSGNGLRNQSSRMSQIGGKLTWLDTGSRGTRVQFQVTLTADSTSLQKAGKPGRKTEAFAHDSSP